MRYTPVSRLDNPLQRRRAQRPERVVFVVGLAGMALLSIAYFASSRISERVVPLTAAPSETQPKVALLSSRRTPNNLSDITRIGSFERALATFAKNIPSSSCAQVDWLGKSHLRTNSDLQVIPASAAKVLTAAAAIDILSPTHTFTTSIKATTAPLNGVVENLYFIGGGDPLLSRQEYIATEKYKTLNPTSLESLADKIAATGIRTVTGSIIVDDSRFDAVRFVDVWPSSFHYTESGPLGALMVNDGVIIGQPTKPDDPAISSAVELRTLLAARGITVASDPRRDVIPPNSVDIASVQSVPLTQVVQEMLVNSDNNTGEILAKEIGVVSSKQGTTAAGLQSILSTLTKKGIAPSTILKDGSGLSNLNRVSCSDFNKVLTQYSTVLPPLMAVAGETGTIRDMFNDSPMKGRLLGKTGTLNGVKALVGYLPIESSEPVIFSLVLNATAIDNQSAYRPIWNALGTALNSAKSEPRVEQLAP